MSLKNMKFKVVSPEQSERLQKVLFGLGYKWTTGVVQYTEKPHLYTDKSGYISFSDVVDGNFFVRHWNTETGTEAFIVQHTDKPFEGLEEAYNEPKSVGGSPWFTNNGTMPDLPEGTLVDISLDGYGVLDGTTTDAWKWDTGGSIAAGLILKWRYTNAKDYYKAPKTKVNLPASSQGKPETDVVIAMIENFVGETEVVYVDSPTAETGVATKHSPLKELVSKLNSYTSSMSYNDSYFGEADGFLKGAIREIDHIVNADEYRPCLKAHIKETTKETPMEIDKHYNFSYALSQDDVDAGFIKIDPYFVSQQWNLGSKDSTGVIFHCLKNISRYGDKNTKEREIVALHKQIVRLAQLEGISLETGAL